MAAYYLLNEMNIHVNSMNEPSIAFKAGQEAKRFGIKLKDSAIRNN